MSKEIEWSELYGVGTIVCTCDNCSAQEEFEFDDNNPDFRAAQNALRRFGWMSCKVHGEWYDFCSEKCRNNYIKAH